jgi:hypothetical protein
MKKNYANPELGISQEPFERPKGKLDIDVDCEGVSTGGGTDDFDEEEF